MRIAVAIILFVLMLPESLCGQPHDLVTVVVPELYLRKGKTNRVVIWVEVKEGYHIQANMVNDESLIPTSLSVDGGENVITARERFPKGKKFRLEGTTTVLKVYDGKFPVKIFLTPAADLKSGKYDLEARLQYQACDSRTCLFPRVINFVIPVKVSKKVSKP